MSHTDKDFIKFVGVRLKNERKKNNLTINELAAVMNVSPQTINCIERGTRGTHLENYKRLTDILGCSLDSITTFDCATLSSPSEPSNGSRKDALIALCKGLDEEQAILVTDFVTGLLGYSKSKEKNSKKTKD